ncbi:MAG: pyridoxamine 5'-phosphate oxidase [Chloroflexi bacterium]|nr:pyridoxamine 5'-phosphate oxidase [Chloroflexota bacterium]
MELDDLDPDPIRQLGRWLEEAEATSVPLPTAFALATADVHGSPSVRFVLLHGLGSDGLRYFTNRVSRKGLDVAANPRAAAAFWWPQLDRQARVAGRVEPLGEAHSLAYWRTRPRGSQLSAAVSEQGAEIASRGELEAIVRALAARYPDEVPLPETWGGYLLVPERIEFWTSQPDRLHDRIEYVMEPDGWQRRRLQP